MKKTLLLLIAAALMTAQDAEIKDLTPEDSAEGQRLYDAQNAAEKAYNAAEKSFNTWKSKTAKKYLKSCPSPSYSSDTQVHSYSCLDYEFSKGFKHIHSTRLPLAMGDPGGTWNNDHINLGCPYYQDLSGVWRPSSSCGSMWVQPK